MPNDCPDLICDKPDDLAIGGGIFSLVGYSFVVSCPPGFYCFVNQQTVTFPSNVIPPVVVPPLSGAFITLRLQGCLSLIVRVLPASATPAQIAAAAASMQAEWAAQQAICNVISPPPGGGPGTPQPPAPPPKANPPPGPGPGSGTPPGTTVPRVDLRNTAQTFTASCIPPLVGPSVTKTVPAGTYAQTIYNATAAQIAFVQGILNTQALTQAAFLANSALVCVSTCPSIIDNIVTANFLNGFCCYATNADLICTARANDVGWINDNVELGDSINFGVENPLWMCFAPSSGFIYCDISTAHCYIAVIDPVTRLLTGFSFNNAFVFDFEYLTYAPVIDRVLALQGDGVGRNLIIANPNTNSIVATTPFSADAANEFAGGVDYCTTNNTIYVGRASFIDQFSQTVQLFTGAGVFSGSIDVSPIRPRWVTYVADFDMICVGGLDFNTSLNFLQFINPATNTIVNTLSFGQPFTANPIVYNPISKQLYINTSSQISVIDMATQTVTCTILGINDPLSMAFNTVKNKAYLPGVGTMNVATLG